MAEALKTVSAVDQADAVVEAAEHALPPRASKCSKMSDSMVEAPGFAPGSENTSSQESTMRIRV